MYQQGEGPLTFKDHGNAKNDDTEGTNSVRSSGMPFSEYVG